MQEKLTSLYRDFFSKRTISQSLAGRLRCPLLISIGPRWHAAKNRVLVVGQETMGWEFEAGSYYAWPYPTLDSFGDFQRCEQGVEALIHGYAQFEFAKYQPANYRSPFWQAFRLIESQLTAREGDILWSNLFRCSLDGGSVVKTATPTEIQEILTLQSGLLAQEIQILSPTAVMFFTGPYYDFCMQAEFSGIKFAGALGRESRQVAQVSHPMLPLTTYRTYHPGFLCRDKTRWKWLEKLVNKIGSATDA